MNEVRKTLSRILGSEDPLTLALGGLHDAELSLLRTIIKGMESLIFYTLCDYQRERQAMSSIRIEDC